MNSEVQVMPQQIDITNTDERIIRRPIFIRPPFLRPFFWRIYSYFLETSIFLETLSSNCPGLLAGLLGGVLGGLLVSTFI